MTETTTATVPPLAPHLDLLETAWGVIANAGWDDNSKAPGWQVAAETWRDRYHAYLKAVTEEAHPEPKGRLARVEVKGFRDLGIVRISETTLAGEPMLHAECDDGSAADFPPSSLHFITWLPEGTTAVPRAAIGSPRAAGTWDGDSDDEPWVDPDSDVDASPTCPCGEHKDSTGDCPGSWHGCDHHDEGDED